MEMMRAFGATVDMTKNGFIVPGRQRYRPAGLHRPGRLLLGGVPAGRWRSDRRGHRDRPRPQGPAGRQGHPGHPEGFGAEVRRGSTSIRASSRASSKGTDRRPGGRAGPVPHRRRPRHPGQGDDGDLSTPSTSDSRRATASLHHRFPEGDGGGGRGDEGRLRRSRGRAALKGAIVDSLDDHRILMAAAIAALVAEGTTIISDGDCYKISYPRFRGGHEAPWGRRWR